MVVKFGFSNNHIYTHSRLKESNWNLIQFYFHLSQCPKFSSSQDYKEG